MSQKPKLGEKKGGKGLGKKGGKGKGFKKPISKPKPTQTSKAPTIPPAASVSSNWKKLVGTINTPSVKYSRKPSADNSKLASNDFTKTASNRKRKANDVEKPSKRTKVTSGDDSDSDFELGFIPLPNALVVKPNIECCPAPGYDGPKRTTNEWFDEFGGQNEDAHSGALVKRDLAILEQVLSWEGSGRFNVIDDDKDEPEPTTSKKKAKAKRVESAVKAAAPIQLAPSTEESAEKEATTKERGVDSSHSEAAKTKIGKYIGMDCEMVGVGPDGTRSVLARVSLVNFHGHTLLDTFVKPQEKVTDYRTHVSGVTPKDVKDAPSFQAIAKQVADLTKDRIIVGHGLKNDFDCLLLNHPNRLVRDTANYKPFRDRARGRTPALRKLAKELLGLDIQKGEHSSVEDARVAMLLYKSVRGHWESSIAAKGNKGVMPVE